jgi:hypothetical protein
VLPCVDVFVADEFCVWAPILWTCLALRWGAQLADVPCILCCGPPLGSPTCGRALHCVDVGAPNLRTCLAFRLGAHLAEVPCIALGRPTLVRPYLKVYLHAKICSYPSSSSSFCLVLPCVDVFVADEFFFWATILRTRLVLRLGAQLANVPYVALGRPTCGRMDVPCVALGHPTCGHALRVGAILKSPKLCSYPSSILSFRVRALWMSFSRLQVRWGPTCGRALCCVGEPNLRTCLVLHLSAHLANMPCIGWGSQPWSGYIKKSTSMPKFVLIHPPAHLLA